MMMALVMLATSACSKKSEAQEEKPSAAEQVKKAADAFDKEENDANFLAGLNAVVAAAEELANAKEDDEKAAELYDQTASLFRSLKAYEPQNPETYEKAAQIIAKIEKNAKAMTVLENMKQGGRMGMEAPQMDTDLDMDIEEVTEAPDGEGMEGLVEDAGFDIAEPAAEY